MEIDKLNDKGDSMSEGTKQVLEYVLYELRDIKKDVKYLTETVTTLKVKISIASGFFGVVGGIVVQIVNVVYKTKGQ